MIDAKAFEARALTLAEQKILGLGAKLAREFRVSRSAASSRLRAMVEKGQLASEGKGRGKIYKLATHTFFDSYPIEGLTEEFVWRSRISSLVRELPENIRDIWHYGITEMVNNAIDHSGSETVGVQVASNAKAITCIITDMGEGIFHKIQNALGLYDPRDSLIELAKGKLTTDPQKHTGEGIFFTSKAFDCFQIHSQGLVYAHLDGMQDVIMDKTSSFDDQGTTVFLMIANDSNRSLNAIMDEFAAPDDYTFSKTIFPIRLAVHEGEKLVSRSQAKRITFRFERFERVILDFRDVEEIGQAFADELFRVFQTAHPGTMLIPMNMAPRVKAMLKRVTQELPSQ